MKKRDKYKITITPWVCAFLCFVFFLNLKLPLYEVFAAYIPLSWIPHVSWQHLFGNLVYIACFGIIAERYAPWRLVWLTALLSHIGVGLILATFYHTGVGSSLFATALIGVAAGAMHRENRPAAYAFFIFMMFPDVMGILNESLNGLSNNVSYVGHLMAGAVGFVTLLFETWVLRRGWIKLTKDTDDS